MPVLRRKLFNGWGGSSLVCDMHYKWLSALYTVNNFTYGHLNIFVFQANSRVKSQMRDVFY